MPADSSAENTNVPLSVAEIVEWRRRFQTDIAAPCIFLFLARYICDVADIEWQNRAGGPCLGILIENDKCICQL